MVLSPLDDYPIHQAAQVMRHVATSDRNFYDRYYFNCHPGTDELMLIVGPASTRTWASPTPSPASAIRTCTGSSGPPASSAPTG